MSVVLGRSIESAQEISLSDSARQSGLYILGKPRVGKSWLMVNLILQDIQHGHGVFFLDPHGDAITDLLYSSVLDNRFLLFDPESIEGAFGINVLECVDVDDPRARSDTFSKAKGLFDKLWKNTFEEKPWLQLILQNTIYAFIENQGYTIAEFPLFFRDSAFRAFVVGNMRYNRQVKDYWLNTFALKSRHDQQAIMEAAETRAVIMLAHPYVADIIGQSKSTIDFSRLIEDQAAILLKLSTALPYETKKIIGTIVVSELLHAVQRRTNRRQFCIFVDEFQNYASYSDFSILITQAPKFGVATTIAHHERYGQLWKEPEILGATAAIGNKVVFQLTGKDAQEFAPELAKPPPTETRDEDVYVISQAPFYDLLYGHNNSEVRALVNICIRPIKERLEDIYGEKEAERLMRLDFLDMAGIHRIDEITEATRRPQDTSGLESSLARAAGMIFAAMGQTVKLKRLNEEGMLILATIRVLNRLFVDVMEEQIKIGSEDFSDRLIEISKIATLQDEDRHVLKLYIAIAYGDQSRQRILPFECAKRRRLLIEHVETTELAIKTEYDAQLEAFAKRVWQIDFDPLLKENMRSFYESRQYWEIERRKDVYNIEDDRRRMKVMCEYAIKDYAKGQMPKAEIKYGLTKLFDLLEEIGKGFKPLIRRQPQDITIDASNQMYVSPLRDDLTARGYEGVVESVDGLTKLCGLLGMPENNLQVKTKQRVQKAVHTRTVADMVNEMIQELTELRRYTAYAKILGESAGRYGVWKGNIETLEVIYRPGITNPGLIDSRLCKQYYTAATTRPYLRDRASIEEVSIYRQESWRDDQSDKPPPAQSDAAESVVPEMGEAVEVDEPPPSCTPVD